VNARRALTLVEVILATVVIGVMMAGALATVSASQRASKAQADQALANLLAQDLLDEIMALPYADASDTAVANGPTAAETLPGNRSLLNDVNDYKNWSESPPRQRDGTAITGAAALTRRVAVEFLTPNAWTTPSATDQGVARITVSVSRGGGTIATAVGVRTSGLPATQACRLANSTCVDLTPARCAELGGTAQGEGTRCWTLRDAAPATLVAHWKFEDPLPVTALDSAGLHVATLVNGPTFISRGGVWGNALKLDGSNDHGRVMHAADLSLTRKFTLMAWVYSENFVTNFYQYVLNKGTTVGGNQNYYLGVFGSYVMVGYYDGTYHDVIDTSTKLTRRTWTHVAATVDMDVGVARIFIGGLPKYSGTISGTIPTNTEDLYIGRSEWTNDYWKGRLDDVRIYDGIVSDADIQKIFKGQL
jgi:type II secretory pathway pseudopilin PulG